MRFKYLVFDKANVGKKGFLEAPSLREATQLLISRGWYVKKIKPLGKAKGGFNEISLGRVSLIDKVLFIRHLATMLKSGITLNEALGIIAEQATSQKFKKIINKILDRVKSGQNLSNSLAAFPRVFDPLFINIIAVGEESGTLEENLNYLAGELEDRLELRGKIKAASLYPSIILFATFGLILILAYFVLPKITRLFESLSFELPVTTKILLWLADLMDKHGTLIILGFIFGVILLKILSLLKPIKPLWHALVLRLPIVGRVVLNYNLTLISRTMAILFKSGITIDRSLEIVIATVKNIAYQQKLKKVLPQVQKGQQLSDVLEGFNQSKRNPMFPLMVIKMISVGERSGRLDESFVYLAQYFDKEVDNETKNLMTILEPILLVVVGLIVGFVAISVISPIYQVTGQLNR